MFNPFSGDWCDYYSTLCGKCDLSLHHTRLLNEQLLPCFVNGICMMMVPYIYFSDLSLSQKKADVILAARWSFSVHLLSACTFRFVSIIRNTNFGIFWLKTTALKYIVDNGFNFNSFIVPISISYFKWKCSVMKIILLTVHI